MATAETTVTGRYLDLNGNAISSAQLIFRLLDIGVDDDVAPQEVFARNPRSVQTDSSGDFSVVLWNNGSSDVDSVYEVRFPDNRTKRFIIPVGSAGGTIDLATLLALHQTTGSSQQSVIQGNLDQFAADPQSNDNYYSTTWRSRLNVEDGATADQTAGEIKTLYESNSDTNAFTDDDHSKLDGIEASADVTDTTNVTAAGALMDSELTNEAAVKAINQGLATTDDVEFNGITLSTDLAITEGGTGASTASAARTNLGFITATATLDFPSISSNHSEELTMTVTGAATGDVVILGAPSAIESGLTWCGYVSAADTVTVRLHNSSGDSVNPASATWKATVIN